MEKQIYPHFNYSHFVDNLFLTSTGTLVAIYSFRTPPVYTLSAIDYQIIFATLNDAFMAFKEEEICVHKQDLFIRKDYDADKIKGDSYLSQAKQKRFENTQIIEQRSFLMFSINNLKSLDKAYITNPFKFNTALHVNDQKRVSGFKKLIIASVAKINEIANFKLSETTQEEIKAYLFNYRTLFGKDTISRDFWSNTEVFTNGKSKVCGYALTEEQQLPDTIKLYAKDRVFRHPIETNESNDLDFLQTMFCENLGITLKYTHVLNQVWKFNPKYISDFELTVSKTKKFRNFSKDLQIEAEKKEKELTQIKEDKRLLCEFSFSLLLIEEEHLFDEAKDQTETMITRILPKMYQPTGEGLTNLFFGNILGFENKLHPNFFYLTNLDASLSLSVFGANEQENESGIVFNERNTNAPLVIDLWNKPFGETIKARNGIIISSTGGGKSVLALNIIRQHIEQGTKVIVLEIGKSFELLTKIYKDRSVHIRYNEKSNIGFNPFKVDNGERPNHTQQDQICDLISRFLQQNGKDRDKKAEKNTIEDLIRLYYMYNNEDYSFDSFYAFINEKRTVVEDTINEKYFDINRFLLVCRDFCTGGRYANLCKQGDSSFLEKDLIVIELSDIANNQFLFGYFMYILTLLMDSILMDRGVKSMLFLDEYGETSNRHTEDDSFNIHETVAYCYQKLRKENSACYIAIQHAEQLSEDNFTKTIFTQTDLLFVPQTGRDIYKQIIKAFSIESQKTINLLYSMNSHFEKGKGLDGIEDSYSEVLVLVAKEHPHVVRICLSKEEFLSYQTEGDINSYIIKRLDAGEDLKDIIDNMIQGGEPINSSSIIAEAAIIKTNDTNHPPVEIREYSRLNPK